MINSRIPAPLAGGRPKLTSIRRFEAGIVADYLGSCGPHQQHCILADQSSVSPARTVLCLSRQGQYTHRRVEVQQVLPKDVYKIPDDDSRLCEISFTADTILNKSTSGPSPGRRRSPSSRTLSEGARRLTTPPGAATAQGRAGSWERTAEPGFTSGSPDSKACSEATCQRTQDGQDRKQGQGPISSMSRPTSSSRGRSRETCQSMRRAARCGGRSVPSSTRTASRRRVPAGDCQAHPRRDRHTAQGPEGFPGPSWARGRVC